MSTQAVRKQRGAWYTPADLVTPVVDALIDGLAPRFATLDRPLRVLDPACGDGRFLEAVRGALRASAPPITAELVGCDIDPDALAVAGRRGVATIHADALSHDWGEHRFDLVVGNPPFLSQMAVGTTRGGSSRHGGGPYADAAAEFLALSVRLARPDGGRIGLVLPQSILAARDAGPVRDTVDRMARMIWSWWERDQRHFDANVNVCALVFERPATGTTAPWTRVVTRRIGIPDVDASTLRTDRTVGDRAHLNANFRDEYYALVPAVADDADGPPLVTSGLIDPGVCHWGVRPVRFAKRTFDHPRVDLGRLDGRFVDWASRKLVPKVLVASQTRILEAVADPAGDWLPGVPVTTLTPHDPDDVWPIAAVLTSPVASALAWHEAAGSGLSTSALRVGPRVLAALPWPAGPLDRAISSLRSGDVVGCGEHTVTAFGIGEADAQPLLSWWNALLRVGTSP